MKKYNDQRGHVLLVTLILVGLGTAVVVGSLDMTSLMSKTVSSKKVRTREVNLSEAGVQEALSWLRQNSQKLITPFRREEFYNRFDKSTPSVGSNDTGNFQVPTMIKMNGTNNSAILFSDANLGSSAFPATWDITTNSSFSAISEFQGTDFGNVKVRITLVNALADDPTLDYGPPPNNTPDTDFYPIYRVDAFNEQDKGSHFYALVSGSSNHIFDMGLYGQDYLEIRQPCDSYVSDTSTYSNATKRANCPAGSNSTSAIHKNEEIYGTLQTNGSIAAEPPYGGETCADFAPNCPNKGETCAGEDCGVPLLEIFKDWSFYCPAGSEKPLINIKNCSPNPTTITVASDAPTDRCFSKIQVANNAPQVIFTTSQFPYFIRELDVGKAIRAQPTDPNGTIELYVLKFTGDRLNGNVVVNGVPPANPGKPTNLKIYYLGTDTLTLNGNLDFYGGFVAPRATVTVSGSANYFGALLAKELYLTGSGAVHYDESLGGSGLISDMQYKLHETSQRYR